jgi:hypothetical protein
MSSRKYSIKYEDIIDMAEAVIDNPILYKPGLIMEYPIDSFTHKKLNEELYFRTKGHEEGLELEYHEVIELTIQDINFKFTISDGN